MSKRLCYLGPIGTFTNQAALIVADRLGNDVVLEACDNIADVFQAATNGDYGVIAWDNNVEGTVVPNMDRLLDAQNLAGVMRVSVPITFDAFITQTTAQAVNGDLNRALAACATVTAHPHGLAQCRTFIESHHLTAQPASSNAAGCAQLSEGVVSLAPSICGDLYHRVRVGRAIQDFDGACTDFLVITRRDTVLHMLQEQREHTDEYESIIAFIPLVTGAGVLANLLDVLRDGGLNMTSFMSRPIKGHDGTYSFIATIDAAPWQVNCRRVLDEILEHGDWVKTLAVYPRRERANPPVTEWMLPAGGVHLSSAPNDWRSNARREMLW